MYEANKNKKKEMKKSQTVNSKYKNHIIASFSFMRWVFTIIVYGFD